jgi:hypothetical protein
VLGVGVFVCRVYVCLFVCVCVWVVKNRLHCSIHNNNNKIFFIRIAQDSTTTAEESIFPSFIVNLNLYLMKQSTSLIAG